MISNIRNCDHTEGLVQMPGLPTTRLPVDKHDCAYVNARNALIPEAEKIADDYVKAHNASVSVAFQWKEGDTVYKNEWSRRFISAMDQLWASRNTRSQAQAA